MGLGEKGEGIKEEKNLMNTDNSTVISRGKGGWVEIGEDKGGM